MKTKQDLLEQLKRKDHAPFLTVYALNVIAEVLLDIRDHLNKKEEEK